MMGWRPSDVGACDLGDFRAAWEGFLALHGKGRGRLSGAERDEARRILASDDGAVRQSIRGAAQ